VHLPRSSGILLHPTSLPEGRLGRSAYAWIDWLAAAGQRWWQVLPLGPPDAFGSPYASASAFAAWPGLLADPEAPVSPAEVAAFRERHAYWLSDWEAFAGAGAAEDQVRFDREWGALRAYAAERGVRVIGDVPIYVAAGSADHLAHPRLFRRGVVAGAPPDALNADGQLWGNPLFDWDAVAADGYRWWIERLRRTFELVDLARIDHFRGFAAYWTIPAGATSARAGHWTPGPGAAVFRAAEAELGELPVIAEDLGVITPDVERLRDELGFPGMAVLVWAYGGGPDNPHRLENHRERQVVYTTTHDTHTAVGWWLAEGRDAGVPLDPAEPHWSMIRDALGSRASLAIIPLQDVLGLDDRARMNTPGRAEGNWRWRLSEGTLTAELAERLRAETAAAGRL
jgi:4-alpha-glucanotransferase